jgi:hypothetical protein
MSNDFWEGYVPEPVKPAQQGPKIDIYRSFEQWKSGNVLEHGVPRTEHYSEAQLDLVEMGWNYGYDAGRAVEQALDKKADNARELGLDYEPAQQEPWPEEPAGHKAGGVQLSGTSKSKAITELYALFGAPHNADINLTGLNMLLDALIASPPTQPVQDNPLDCGVYLGSGKDHAIKHHVSYGPAQPVPDAFEQLMREADKPTQVLQQGVAEYVDALIKGTHEITSVTIRPKRTWVGLTDEEIEKLTVELRDIPVTLAFAIEAKLRERNT